MVFRVHQDITRCIPDLVTEIAVPLGASQVESQVPAGGRDGGKGKPDGVGPEGRYAVGEMAPGAFLDTFREMRLHHPRCPFPDQAFKVDAVDQVQRVKYVALGLGHLLAFLITDQAVDINFREWRAVHELETHHDHPGDPEEDDIEAGDKHGRRVISVEIACLLRPAERRKGPQRRGEPGIEDILVLCKRHFVTMMRLCLLPRRLFIAGDKCVSILVVPGRDPVSPPELAADAPVLDVPHPFEIGFRPVVRNEPDRPIFHGADGRFRQRTCFYIPLIRQVGLDYRTAAITPWHHQLVVVCFLDKTERLQILDNAFSCLESIQPAIGVGRVVIETGIDIEEIYFFQVVPLADLVIVEVVRRGDFHATAAELRIDIVVCDNRDAAAGQRKIDHAADEMPVTFVIRANGHGGIAQHRLRTGRGHDQEILRVDQRVTQVPQVAVLFLRQDFEIRQGGVQHGVPIHEPLAAVDQPFFVETDKDLGNGIRQLVVHREALTAPVHRGAETPQLRRDGPTGFFFPVPDAVDKCIPADVRPRCAGRIELAFYDHLGRDAGMIHPCLPQRILAAHAI